MNPSPSTTQLRHPVYSRTCGTAPAMVPVRVELTEHHPLKMAALPVCLRDRMDAVGFEPTLTSV